MNNLARKTLLGFVQLIIGLGISLFAPGWTLDFWQAWAYLFVFAVSTALITAYLWKKDPELLVRRVKAGPGAEKEKSQKLIQLFASIAFIGVFILPSLDHRFSWSDVPLSHGDRRGRFSSARVSDHLHRFQGEYVYRSDH